MWSIICSGVSIDKSTNNVSLFNVIEQVQIPRNNLVEVKEKEEKWLAIPMPFYLMMLWSKPSTNTIEKASVEIKLVDSKNKSRKIGEFDIKFAPKMERIRFKFQYAGIRVSSSGAHVFKIFLREDGQKKFREVGSAQLSIEILPETKPVISNEG